MFVMSTAGHIDHGKSVLVQALTGIDPDRLREEKERGMTIDLGFAWMKLPGGREVGIVDVPGHEKFIGNMLAGVGGVDLTLLVVAANEGVMPQTREHVAILDLLEIKKGVVAVTKTDLVDEEWLELVKMDIEELLSPTTLAGSPIVPVSVMAGRGIPELKAEIEKQLESAESRKDLGRPRLPIDRIFTIAGAGTIVTGTLIDGTLRVGQDVEIVPKGLKSRIRGLQTHKTRTEVASPGSRTAANLVGVTVAELERGNVLSRPGVLTATSLVSAKLRLLDYIHHNLRHSTEVTFFSGAAVSLAKVRLLEGDELKPGVTTWAQFVLDKPMALVNGDHYIIRSTTDTIGGGRIIETHPRMLRRRRPEVLDRLKTNEGGTVEDKIFTLLQTKQPVELASLINSPELPVGEVKPAVGELISRGRVITIGSGGHELLMTGPWWDDINRKAAEILQGYYKKFPLRTGMPKEEFRNRLKLSSAFNSVLTRLLEDGVIIESGTEVNLPSHEIQLTPAQQSKIKTFLETLNRNPYAPTVDIALETDLLNLLVQQKRAVKVSGDVVFSAEAYNEMENKVVAYLKVHGKITLAETRDMFKTSRKYTQALLEYMDGQRITRRVGDDRVLL